MGKSASIKKQKKSHWITKNNAEWTREKKEQGVVASESAAVDLSISVVRMLERNSKDIVKDLAEGSRN